MPSHFVDADESANNLRYYLLLREAFFGKIAKAPRTHSQTNAGQPPARLPRPSAAERDALPCSQVYQRGEDLPECIREQYRAAGILPFAHRDGEVFVLLGQEEGKTKRDRARGASWSAFGGKRESTDSSMEFTAAREFIEETGGNVFLGQEQAFEAQLKQGSPVLWLKDALYCLLFLQIPFIEFTASWASDCSLPSSSSSSSSLTKPTRPMERPFKNPCHEKCSFIWISFTQLCDVLPPVATSQSSHKSTTADSPVQSQELSTNEKQELVEERGKSMRLAGFFYGLLALPGALTTLASFSQPGKT